MPNYLSNYEIFFQNTYLGRFYHNVELIDPRTLFVNDVRILFILNH